MNVLCVVAGHRWSEAAEIHESYPVLRCGRCHVLRELSPGSRPPEGWTERGARAARACMYDDADMQRRR